MTIQLTSLEVEEILRIHITKIIALKDGQIITSVSLANSYQRITTIEIEKEEPKIPESKEVPLEHQPPDPELSPKAPSSADEIF